MRGTRVRCSKVFRLAPQEFHRSSFNNRPSAICMFTLRTFCAKP